MSQATGTSEIILSQGKLDKSNLILDYGQYCQVYENTRNNMTPRSVGRITLRTKNDRGSYYFMPIKTSMRIHARQRNVLHLTESVIGRLE